MRQYRTVDEFEVQARSRLSPQVFNYYFSGADDEITLGENIMAFNKYAIRPSVCSGVNQVDTRTQIFGKILKRPFGFAPSAMQKLAHPHGERLSAKVAKQEVQQLNGNGLRFLQLYINKDRQITTTLIRMAEQYGFGGLVITVDAQVLGKRIGDMKAGFSSPEGTKFQILEQIQKRMSSGKTARNLNRKDFQDNRDLALDWTFIGWVRSITSMPIILKGIFSVEDAQIALKHKVEAIWISNHGGRQLDTVRASIDVLADISNSAIYSNTASQRPYIFIDSGVRKGTDIFKSLALGADYVFVGRPLVYSLVEGQQGVRTMVQILSEQLQQTMKLAGTRTLAQISKSSIIEHRAKL